MTGSDLIGIIGAVVTVISTGITIYFASQTKSYKEQMQFDMQKINLSNIVEKLKRTQDEIRALPKSLHQDRGVRVKDIIKNIQAHFDYVLNILDSDGPEIEIRGLIFNAQAALNKYEIDYEQKQINPDDVVLLTANIQEAIAKSNTKIFKLEKDVR